MDFIFALVRTMRKDTVITQDIIIVPTGVVKPVASDWEVDQDKYLWVGWGPFGCDPPRNMEQMEVF